MDVLAVLGNNYEISEKILVYHVTACNYPWTGYCYLPDQPQAFYNKTGCPNCSTGGAKSSFTGMYAYIFHRAGNPNADSYRRTDSNSYHHRSSYGYSNTYSYSY